MPASLTVHFSPVRSLDTPDVTTSYNCLTGFTLSWDAVDGAEGYTLINLGNLTLGGSYVDVPCGTSVHVTAKVANGFERTGYYAVVAYGHDLYGNAIFSEISDFIDLSKATTGGPVAAPPITTASDTQILLTWNNGSATEDGYAIERADIIDGIYVTLSSTIASDTTSYIDSTALAGHTYTYRIKATRTTGDGHLDSDWMESYETHLFT
jgi:hypothetical protein